MSRVKCRICVCLGILNAIEPERAEHSIVLYVSVILAAPPSFVPDAPMTFKLENTSRAARCDSIGSCALSSDLTNSSSGCVMITTLTPPRTYGCSPARPIICMTSIGESSSNHIGSRRVDLRPLDADGVHLDVDAKFKLLGADEDSQTSVGVEVFHQT